MKLNTKSMAKAAVYMAVAAGFFAMAAYADYAVQNTPQYSIGNVAATVVSSFGNVAEAVSAISYLAGLGFTIASFFKLKQHKDNPQQIPVTNGLAMLAIGAALIFTPSIFRMVGATLFDQDARSAGVQGISVVPGQENNPGNN